MKRTIKLAVVAALALGATSAFATNGDVMIGQGAKARSMGGVGVATSFGAESALANPANIASVKDSEFTGALTFFTPTVGFGSNAQANIMNAMGANGYQGTTTAPVVGSAFDTDNPADAVAGTSSDVVMADSAAPMSIIPEFYYATRLSDELVAGVAVAGTAGMGTDHKDNDTNGAFHMFTALQLLKVAVPVSYTVSGINLGIAPVLQYGSLQMSHDTFSTPVDNGAATDIGYGFEAGLSYDMAQSGVDGLTLGLVYKSKIAMEYKDVIGASLVAFGADTASRVASAGAADGISSGDKLDQPAEFGFGLSYENSGNTLAVDYRSIAWGDAAGYADFGWENQTVVAVGYEYAANGWALRAGYNYAKSPIAEQEGSKTGILGSQTAMPGGNYMGAVKNIFNLSGFPGVVESHITFGGAYAISDALSFDAAVIIVPEVTESFDTSGLTEGATYNLASDGVSQNTAGAIAQGAASSTADVTHSQMGVTLAMTYKF